MGEKTVENEHRQKCEWAKRGYCKLPPKQCILEECSLHSLKHDTNTIIERIEGETKWLQENQNKTDEGIDHIMGLKILTQELLFTEPQINLTEYLRILSKVQNCSKKFITEKKAKDTNTKPDDEQKA